MKRTHPWIAAGSLLLAGLVGCGAAPAPAPSASVASIAPRPVASSPRVSLSAEVASSLAIPLPVPAPVAPIADPIRHVTDWWADRSLAGIHRSRGAVERRSATVQAMFDDAGVSFPPAELMFRVFKQDRQLEVWASSESDGAAKKIATYEVCAASGVLGPKRYEGDLQVPEGFYVISYGWAESAYHLEMKVSYPNMVDRVRGPHTRPLGGEIMIHGGCASIGCVAVGDERVEELWTMMKPIGNARVKVHLFPARDMDALLADATYAEHHELWKNLKSVRDAFEKDHVIRPVHADWRGIYELR